MTDIETMEVIKSWSAEHIAQFLEDVTFTFNGTWQEWVLHAEECPVCRECLRRLVHLGVPLPQDKDNPIQMSIIIRSLRAS